MAAIGDMADHPRVSIQNNTIASNPFPRSITMGVVNLPVWGYDASRFEMSPLRCSMTCPTQSAPE